MDEETEKGIRNLEELLYRLDQRAKDIQWYKERGWEVPPATPAEPDEIGPVPPQVAKFMEKGAEKKSEPAKAPEAAPAPEVVPAAEVVPAPAPEVATKPEIVPTPEVVPAQKVITAPEVTPAPEFKLPEFPAVEIPLPVIEPAPVPVEKPVLVPAEEKPAPAAAEVNAPVPEIKAAKLSSSLNKKLLVILLLSMGVAGVVYQFVLNTPRFRYGQAARLMAKARYSEAISAYSRVITQFPRTPQAAYSQYDIADIKAAQGDAAEAMERYQEFLKIAPEGDVKIAAAKIKMEELQRGKEGGAIIIQPEPAPAAPAKPAAVPAKKQPAKPAGMAPAAPKPAAKPAKAPATKPAPQAKAEEPEYKPAPASSKKAVYTHDRLNACNSVWAAERTMGRLDANTAAEKRANDCDGLKSGIAACKGLQEEFDAIQTKLPADRAAAKQQSDPSWTEEKQMAQDDVTIDAYEAQRCGDLMNLLQD